MVRPDTLVRWSLEQRSVYFRALQGDKEAHALKSFRQLERFWKKKKIIYILYIYNYIYLYLIG